MAEVVLKVGAVSRDPLTYQDGDIICAFSSLDVKHVHAQHFCHIKKAGFTSEGLRPNSLARILQEQTYTYKFERVSRREVKRTNLINADQEIFGLKPNAKGEMIHVREYLARRLKHPLHRIFGRSGAEVWYGGRTVISHARLDAVWNAIAAETGKLESAHRLWPLSPTEKRHFLALSVDDFSQDERVALATPKVDVVRDIPLRKRAHAVDYRNMSKISTVTQNAIRDMSIEVDVRGESKVNSRSTIVVNT